MATYTCLTCKVNFSTNEWQKQHYKSEWHQYNLKRKLVDLNCVPFDTFEKIKARQVAAEIKENTRETNKYCAACRKAFSSTAAFDQHCQSKKHREMVERKEIKDSIAAKNPKPLPPSEESVIKSDSMMNELASEDEDDDDDYETVDDDYEEGKNALRPDQCFFCLREADSMEENIKHMSLSHSFFIPDIDYVTDLESLLTYLGEKIGIDHVCLWCSYNGKTFRSTKSAQQHMLCKGHSKINFEQADVLMEYADFYDYSKSYPDAEGADADEEVKIDTLTVDDDSWQLVLPSGSVIGHRSLLRYYKQNLRPIVEKLGHGSSTNQRILDKVMNNYKALGWTGIKGEAAVKRAKDINYFNRLVARRNLDIGMRHNRILTKYFRQQVLF
ncbi:cytoplasmic 60S subunit biogenesis factor ZNF622-like [Panonychus citri]|uniref:cytoplasmic 60S subunit biogenesis factor ZNF622-like n=1 Tax=Panonychus citri TaxID=50023 RepID=UPI0023070D2C|nr:cytoplasmic 60S subunit biogenesis factor ZNF622-like [Panonychus citri]XP_053200398.1 cytoplasmic 60S subunit biogenesis factor ZNF622-like [Panonychus citri]